MTDTGAEPAPATDADTADATDHGAHAPLTADPALGPLPRRSRAGRNLPAALAVGVGLGLVVIGSLFVVRTAFVAVCAVAIVTAVWELAGALAVRGVRVPLVPVVLGAVGMLAAAWYGGAGALLVALATTVLAALLWRQADRRPGFAQDVGAGVLTAVYVPFLAGFAILLLRPDDGAWRVLVFVLVVVCSDVGGYAVGVLAGRHPMAPTVSPKKSWEGAGGSLLACVVGAALAVHLALGGSWWAGAVLGVAGVLSATLGDLGESMVKRDLGIKDMGTLLPGHGGVMDRLDSLLPTAPVVWLLLTLLVPPG